MTQYQRSKGHSATSDETKWCLVEVNGPLEKIPCANPWIEHGLPKKIEGEFSLWQKKVPKVRGKCGVNASQYCKKVVLEHADCALSPVLAMHIWWDKIEFGVPLEGDGFFVCRAGIFAEDLEVNQKSPDCQMCHNGIVGGDEMAVALGLECLLEDDIAISVKGNNDILSP